MLSGVTRGRLATVRRSCLGLGLLLAVCAPTGQARAEPPITSAQDAYCRDQARARVFSTPDPRNIGLHEIGRGIYKGCMRSVAGGKGRRGHRHHRRRHRR